MRIEDDNLSGAAVLTEKALNYLCDLADNFYPSYDVFLSSLKKECQNLAQSHESMISLKNELSLVLKSTEKSHTLEEAQKTLKNITKERIQFLKNAETTTVQYGTSLIKENATVLTHSRSSAVEKILMCAHQKTSFHLIVTESRPNREGTLLAQTLAEKGIPVTLIVDAAATLFSPDVVLVGADSITPTHVVNKIGTKFLASSFNTFVVCTSSKFTTQDVTIEEKDPREVLKESHKNITVKNYYFDRTPLDYFKGFITEYGIKTPQEIRSLIITGRTI